MSISKEDVARVAELARLRLSDAELSAFTAELGAILEYVRQIQELDLADVPPTTQVVETTCRLRPDEPEPSLTRDEALANAPDTEQGQFKVPRIIGDAAPTP